MKVPKLLDYSWISLDIRAMGRGRKQKTQRMKMRRRQVAKKTRAKKRRDTVRKSRAK